MNINFENICGMIMIILGIYFFTQDDIYFAVGGLFAGLVALSA